MKRLLLLLFAAVSFMAYSQTKIYLTVGEKTVSATLAGNAATQELMTLLQNGPVTIQMHDYGGFEKVGELPKSFTTSDTHISTVPGDIMLYQGNNMVIFYGTNSWSYTSLGKIDNATAETVKQFLGTGNIQLKISAQPSAAIGDAVTDRSTENIVYDLKGNLVKVGPLQPGIYIVNGHKQIVSK